MTRIQKLTACAAVALALPITSFAQDSGRAILERAATHMKSLSAFTVDFELELDIAVDDEEENFTTDYTVAFDRVQGAFVHMNNRYQEVYFYTSKSDTTRYVPELKQYMVEDAPSDPAMLVRGASNQYTMPATVIFAELMLDEPMSAVLAGDTPIAHGGAEEVNGVMCDKIEFTYADFDVQVWVAQGDDALVQRISPNLSRQIEEITKRGGDVKKAEIDLRILNWQPNKADEALLTYTPKEDVEKVAQFYRKPPPAPAEALVGQEAAEIELTRLNGESFKLSDYRGKIVLLDFWATWCGPCRIGMPILSKVSKEFADKDVVLFAVNLQDEPEPIKEFLKGAGLEDLKVVMDIEGVTGESYMAESIPQMVVVGKDGIIQKVHVGVTPTYEDDLRKELTELTSK